MENRATSRQLAHSGAIDGLRTELGDWAVGPGPLFRQLARAIASGVERGTLPRGGALPSERALAAALSVSRGTAVAAYDLLVAEGLVQRRPGSGTSVAGSGSFELPSGREGSALVHRLVDHSAGRSGVVDLSISVLREAAGLPDVAVRTEDLRALRPDTGYSPWGLPELRDAIARHVTGWGLPTTAHEVVVTTGAQQAISAAAACWIRPGDTVVVDDPSYPGAVSTFLQAGARLIGLPVGPGGVRPEDLQGALASHPALVYLQSTLHSPTGTVLGEARRRELAAVIARSRVPLVEDLALADLAWREAPPPIASFCLGASVVVVGSLSKLYWGGLRVGWARADEPLALRIARVKATHDLGSSVLGQAFAARLLAAAPPGHVRGRRCGRSSRVGRGRSPRAACPCGCDSPPRPPSPSPRSPSATGSPWPPPLPCPPPGDTPIGCASRSAAPPRSWPKGSSASLRRGKHTLGEHLVSRRGTCFLVCHLPR